ncbi:ABC transporter permease [Nocardioides zeae]|uniref:Transport permease protein n=1 Tax=Nocardioides imazamoxiresistens TaxID=3231893 RepID=A0ABU3PWA0_9ACTN|nr:ABC transporter permease [Nocardioides zeae]MDT9593515.1 ABC transporter permease [Nocardioides zeae]
MTTTTVPVHREAAAGRERKAYTRPTGFLADVATVFVREIRPLSRDPFQVVFSMIQPLFFLALFAPLLPDVGYAGGSALQWFVPGIVAMSCLMGASMVGSNLLLEMQTGSHERLLVAPVRRSALLLGRALKEIVPMLAQSAIIVAVVTPFGFDLHLGGVLVGVAIMAVFAVGMASLSYVLAMAAAGRDWMFWAVQQTFLFPVLLLAGMLLPVDDGPAWLRTLSALNPLTYVVDAERALFAGQWDASTVLAGAGAAAGVAVVGLVAGIRAMRRAG